MRIGFHLAIFENHDMWENLFVRSGKLARPHKAWEIQASRLGWGDLLTFDFSWTRNTDHAGLALKLGLLGYDVEARLYDTRHWDSDKRQWQVYGNPPSQESLKE